MQFPDDLQGRLMRVEVGAEWIGDVGCGDDVFALSGERVHERAEDGRDSVNLLREIAAFPHHAVPFHVLR